MTADKKQGLDRVTLKQLRSIETIDWEQVVLNGGPPCFHVENKRFCLRAMPWQGHGILHDYVSLQQLFVKIDEGIK